MKILLRCNFSHEQISLLDIYDECLPIYGGTQTISQVNASSSASMIFTA